MRDALQACLTPTRDKDTVVNGWPQSPRVRYCKNRWRIDQDEVIGFAPNGQRFLEFPRTQHFLRVGACRTCCKKRYPGLPVDVNCFIQPMLALPARLS